MELFRKEYEKTSAIESVEIVAKCLRTVSSGSRKFTHVHISPVRIEQCTGYAMELNHSSDSCIRLWFSKPYTVTQKKQMLIEVRKLAAEKLVNSALPNEFKLALNFLSTIHD